MGKRTLIFLVLIALVKVNELFGHHISEQFRDFANIALLLVVSVIVLYTVLKGSVTRRVSIEQREKAMQDMAQDILNRKSKNQ